LYQILMDNSDLHALMAIYVSIYIAILLKYLWVWSVEGSFMESNSNPGNTKISHPLEFYRKYNQVNGSFILHRIVKYIRRKESLQDDSEEPFSVSF
jgi:hypothetical protein